MLIIVEGHTDKDFIELYIKRLYSIVDEKYKEKLKSYKIVKTDGVCKLKSVETEIRKHEQIKIIFDADTDFEDSKSNIIKQLEDMGSNFSSKCEIFLMPNNKDNGTLEILLENIAKEKVLLTCFDNYKECLKKLQKDNQNIKLPAKKSKIYAYFHSFGFKNGIKDFKINGDMLDCQSNYLQPLKNFLLDTN
ncbi:hypothetical protein CQA66_05050 [Helicobacter aurati]|uniref:DUF4435 domain-containing protein n=1 Tax=Helicobacter aurati TaxID=137778 RepID=A0A3D8J5B4_9HELI|nr:DUF3226 domain-containing protein [Helicobacter aurati]RDU72430.1 hypothetical protein CQA66_05050 [Helicobacter aurati]